VSVACLVGASASACQRKASVIAGNDAATSRSAQVEPPASAAKTKPQVPKRGSCHRAGPLACGEAPAFAGHDFVQQLDTCLSGYRELDYGRITKVTSAEQIDRGAGAPGTGVAGVAAFALTVRFGAGAEARAARSVYFAAEYGDGLCLVDQLMLPRAPSLPCREQLRFNWQRAPAGGTAAGLIVQTETVCDYAQGARTRCAAAEYRVTDGKFWIVRETDREGACSS
jgi:hypothetical protein